MQPRYRFQSNHATEGKLRKKKVGKNTSGYTKAGGGIHFGNVQEVPSKDARSSFSAHTKSLVDEEVSSKRLTVSEFIELFLGWVQQGPE
jgi:hypothetical protein